MLNILMDLILAAVLVVSFYSDIRHRRIYNKVVFPGMMAGLLLNLLVSGPAGLLFSLQGLLLGIGLLFLPFALGGMGAGDVKLLGVVGAFQGPWFVFYVFLAAALLGGVISLVAMARDYRLPAFVKNALLTLYFLPVRGLQWNAVAVGQGGESAGRAGKRIPYGPAIVLGALAVYAWQFLGYGRGF